MDWALALAGKKVLRSKMAEDETCVAEKVISELLKDGWKMQKGRVSFLNRTLGTNLHKDTVVSTDIRGNFDMGTCFCDVKCIYGHKTRMFNLHRGHYVACDKCKTYIFVGANLKSDWRRENKDIWQANSDSVEGYKFVEF